MMTTEYRFAARSDLVREGDYLRIEAGFDCLVEGEVRIVEKSAYDNCLFIRCMSGCHYLDGLLDADEFFVGLVDEVNGPRSMARLFLAVLDYVRGTLDDEHDGARLLALFAGQQPPPPSPVPRGTWVRCAFPDGSYVYAREHDEPTEEDGQ